MNLYLAVGRPHEDGYHPLATIFQAVDLYDTVTVRESDDLTLTMRGMGNGLPVDGSNLAIRAARALADFAGMEARADIQIDKRIPIAGGMAGGSADAAGTLVALDRLWNLALGTEQLLALGAQLGADVPFCLMGGTALGLGRGDQLTPLISRGLYSWLFVTQQRGLSTPQVFRRFDELRPDAPEIPEIERAFASALAQGDEEFVARYALNDLAEAALTLHAGARAVMEVCEAASLSAFVSGSGPTIAVHVPPGRDADSLSGHIRRSVPGTGCISAGGPVAGASVI